MLEADKPAAIDSWWDEEPVTKGPARFLEGRWSWLIVVGLTFLVFEVTSNSSLALAIGCLKFGWHDLWMARKIRRADPDRIRGRTCARFAQAWGLLKVFLIATVMMFVVVFAEEHLNGPAANRPGGAPPATFITAMLVGVSGLGLSAVVSAMGVVSALRHRVKVWVGGRVNRASIVLMSGLITLFMAGGMPALVIVIAVAQQLGLPAGVAVGASMAILVGGPVAVLLSRDFFVRRIVASTPEQCWPVPLDLNGPRRKEDRTFAGEADQRFVID